MVLAQEESRSNYKIWKIDGLKDYIEFLEQNVSNQFVIYRGQTFDWPLVPRIADLKHIRHVLENEQIIFESFRREAISFLNPSPVTDWDWLAVAQHHGLPTRLLDWTTNALGALWFAVKIPSKERRSGVVWIFFPEEQDITKEEATRKESPFEGTRTKVYLPRHISGRVRSQEGVFTVHKFIDESHRFVALDSNPRQNAKLAKVIIPPEAFPSIRFDLQRCGVHAGSLFPDIVGIAESIKTKNIILDDEEQFSPKWRV